MKGIAFIFIGLIIILSGCVDQDPFGFNNKEIAGDYYLEQWEDGVTFYLNDSEKEYNEFPDHGPIGGTVISLGWNSSFIIAERQAHFGGKVDGWMIIDVSKKKIVGPLPWDEVSSNNLLKDIKIYSAKEAWNVL